MDWQLRFGLVLDLVRRQQGILAPRKIPQHEGTYIEQLPELFCMRSCLFVRHVSVNLEQSLESFVTILDEVLPLHK